MLSWKPVSGATGYHVQVATSSSFDSTVLDVMTTNTHATPTAPVPPGKVWWRVSATKGGGWSKWSTATFNRAQRSGPVLAEPDNGAEFRQSVKPPVLRWDPVPGAQGYSVEIDSGPDPDWVDTKTYTTETTSLVPTETQEPADYYWWRVRADFGGGISSAASDPRSYAIKAMPAVQLDNTASTMEDVVLKWDPVPGAVDYEVRVSTDNDFNVITDHQYVSGTRYSPPTTYDNASYWWQVRARDVFGQTEEWTSPDTQTGVFQRTWPDRSRSWSTRPAGRRPTGTDLPSSGRRSRTPPTTSSTSARTRASRAVLHQSRVMRRRHVRQLHHDPDDLHRLVPPDASTTTRLHARRVRDLLLACSRDRPQRPGRGVLGQRPVLRRRVVHLDAARRCQHRRRATSPDSGSPWTGNGTTACTASLGSSGGVCSGVTSTPMLDWDPAPGAASYIVYLAHDRNFTNMVDGLR